MKRRLSTLLFLGLSTLSVSNLSAQSYIYDTGQPTFSTTIPIENGFINVNNGEIHIEIPLATHAQRGSLQLNERLIYDGRIWKIVHNSSYSWQPTNVPNSMGGWRFSSGLDTGSTTWGNQTATASTCDDGTPVTEINYSGFQWTDPSGTQHVFDGITHGFSTHMHSCVVHPSPTTSGSAVDGSGYTMSVDNYTHMTIWDSKNVQVYPTVIDTNGNLFSKDTNGNLVDTLGRTPVTTTTSGNLIYYDVLGYNGVLQRYKVTTQTVYYNTHFSQQAVSDSSGSFTAIQSIQLPDLSTYSFTYDSGTGSGTYGELTSVTLPSGGTISYTYQNFLDSFQNQNRWLYTRVKDGGTLTLTPSVISNCSGNSSCQEKTIANSPAGDDTVYTFSLPPGASTQAGKSWVVGIDAYQGSSTSGGTKLKGTSTAYTYNTATIANGATYNVPATITNTTTLYDVGLAQQTVTTMDSLGSRRTSVAEWDYFPSSGSVPATPTRQTNYQYFAQSIPSSVTVVDGAGNQLSQTTYTYNETTGAGHAPLQTTTGLPNHGTSARGRTNLTTSANWINTSGTTLTSAATYDDAGTVLSSTDSNGTTALGYDSTDTYTTSLTPPTPSSGVSLGITFGVDVNTGLSTLQTDPNGTQTVSQGYDAFGRPIEVDVLQSGTTYGKTTFSYTSTQSIKHEYQDAGTSGDVESLYDGYGRASRTATANGQATNPWYQSDTCYDVSGRISFQSYPYQGTRWSTPKLCSGAGDSFTYDALNRVKSINHADGTAIIYSYTGRATKVTDENGVAKITQIDGLGRQTKVCEISSSTLQGVAPIPCGTDIAGTGFTTSFAYDLPNHKTTITQGAQTRIFQTDSLGRPVLQKEPESVQTSFSYAYNATGLVITRQRPKTGQTNSAVLTTTTTQYDSVGRVVSITYDDGTPAKSFSYDSNSSGIWSAFPATNLKGQLAVASTSNPSLLTSSLFSYDAMGRTSQLWACTATTCNTSAQGRSVWYSYDWAGNTTSESDGASGSITYGRSLAGEVTSIANQSYSLTGGAGPVTLVSNVVNGSYGPTSYALGNGLSVVNSYDALGRRNGGWVCKGSSSTYCSGGTAQLYGFINGWSGSQVKTECDTVLNQCMNFGYDEFNRLAARTVYQGTAQNFTYFYDRYGNRWQQNLTAGSGPQPAFSFNSSNNRISSSGFGYDAAGNMVADGFHAYHYDAEGNVITVDGSAVSYVYDALNHKVRYQTASTSLEYLFDAAGRVTSDWPTQTFANEGHIFWDGRQIAFRSYNGLTYFANKDWLETDRVHTDSTGVSAATYASLPFGDGGSASISDTYGGWDFSRFGDMEYNAESNTYHSQSRQYSGAQGRWMSPDPYDGSYDFSNPQSFNRYAYVGNNPLGGNDPTGLIMLNGGGSTSGGGDCLLCDLLGDVLSDFFQSLFSLGGSSFHGSLQPRPNSGGNGGYESAYTFYADAYGSSFGLPPAVSVSGAPSNRHIKRLALAQPKLRSCSASLFGNANALTSSNAPGIDYITPSAMRSMTGQADAAATYDTNPPTVLFNGQVFSNPNLNPIYFQTAYLHEAGNLISIRMAGNARAYGGQYGYKYPDDGDSGASFERCIFGRRMQVP